MGSKNLWMPKAMVLNRKDCMADEKKFAVETMKEVAKLLITLASGFLVITVSYLQFIVNANPNTVIKYFSLIVVTWGILAFCIMSGIFALGAIATTTHDSNSYNLDEWWTKYSLRAQQVCFVVSFICFIVFGCKNY